MSTKPNSNNRNRKSTPRKSEGFELYNMLAETIGGMPSLRLKDNLIQTIVIVGCTALAVIIGAVLGGTIGSIVGGILALVFSTLLSGIVLMIMGWIRAAKKIK
jgi:hypothetical protein